MRESGRRVSGAGRAVALTALGLLLAALAHLPAAEPAEQPALATLRAFWAALSAGDAAAFESTVDLPLTLQDLSDAGQPGVRLVVRREDWDGFRRAFPGQPEAGPALALTNVHVEQLGKGLCVVTYNVGPTAEQSSKHTATLVDHGGWKVVFATLPADDPQP